MGGEDDGDVSGGLSGCFDLGRGSCKDNVDIQADQLRRKLAHLRRTFRPAKLDDHVLAHDIPQLAQPGTERLNAERGSGRRRRTQKSNEPDLRRLLRMRVRGPCRGACEPQMNCRRFIRSPCW